MKNEELMTEGYEISVPDGFVRVPLSSIDGVNLSKLSSDVAKMFGLLVADERSDEMAEHLLYLGEYLSQKEVDVIAIAVYRSRSDEQRLIMVTLSSSIVLVDSIDRDTAIAGLLEVHERRGSGSVGTLELPCGPSVIVVSEELRSVDHLDQEISLLHREVTAWTPPPTGKSVVAVSVSSNNWQDWDQVSVLALDVFNSIRWDKEENLV
jgi:hypothetical protein